MKAPHETPTTTTTTVDMLSAALGHTERLGWSCVPVCSPVPGRSRGRCLEHGSCSSPGKVPLVEWRPYQALRPSPELIREWWTRWPQANIGLITGELSGVVAIDLDSQQALNELAALGYPPGPWATTGRVGGRHLFFAWDASAPRNFVKRLGIDYRGEGGLLILAPSLHASGARYQWQERPQADLPLPALPAAIVELAVQRPSSMPGTDQDWRRDVWEGVPEGQRDTALFLEAAKLRGAGVRYDVACQVIEILAGRCRPPFPLDEARAKVHSAYSRYEPNPPEPPRMRLGGSNRVETAVEGVLPKTSRIRSTCVTDVVPETVSWLWPGRIPLGKLTVLDGDPDLGKSAVTLDIAARVSRGGAMPDGTSADLDGPAGVLLLSAEDGLADTVVPRLLAAGADPTHIFAAEEVEEPSGKTRSIELPGDLELMEELVETNNIRLVIVDVLMAYLGDGVNAKQDHDIRRALTPLAKFAERHELAIVAIRHLNKANIPNPLYRGGASIGITGAARSVLLIGADPDDPDEGRRILARVKCNLASPVPSLCYHMEAEGDTVRIVWDGPCGTSARDIVGSGFEVPEDRIERTEAQKFLAEALANGPRNAGEIEKEAREAGISLKRLKTARNKLGVKTEKTDFRGGWLWSMATSLFRGHQRGGSAQEAQAPVEDQESQEFDTGRWTKVDVREMRFCASCGRNLTAEAYPAHLPCNPAQATSSTQNLGTLGPVRANGPLREKPVCEGCGEWASPHKGSVNNIYGHLLHDNCKVTLSASGVASAPAADDEDLDDRRPWWNRG